MEKYGFNGDVVLVPGSVRQIQGLQGGSIHFAHVDSATAINAINQGADLVLISGSLNSFPYSFVAQKEIRKPQDLVGKKIGILAVGGATETATILALKAWNVPRQSVTILSRGRSGCSDRRPVSEGDRCHRTVLYGGERGASRRHAYARGHERNERSVVSHERDGCAPLVRREKP